MRFLVLAAALLFPLSAAAEDQPCRDKSLPTLIDGTAFAVNGDTLGIRGQQVRLWGIQAPELRDKQTGGETPAGMRSRATLADLLADWQVDGKARCRPTNWDRYCQVVAVCTVEGKDLAIEMLARGFAYGFMLDDAIVDDPERGGIYANFERASREQRRGLWRKWLGEPPP